MVVITTTMKIVNAVIHAYESDKGVRAISLGMGKFGLPDTVIDGFSWSFNKEFGDLINIVSQSLIQDGFKPEQKVLGISREKLQDRAKTIEIYSVLDEQNKNGIELILGEGQWEEGDPYNNLIEILFSNIDGKTASENQEQFVRTLFKFETDFSYVTHSDEVLAASKEARKKLNSLRRDFNDGLEPGEYIMVKAPFNTPDGGREWMWVEVMSWSSNKIHGLLKNEPHNIPDLRGGAEVDVIQDEVFDYLRVDSDGNSEGNETGKLLR